MIETEVLVVGAGPAGLAVGYYLQQHGLPFQILERERVGWSWRNHYDSLHLHTLKQLSALPGLPMPASYPDFPSRAQVVAYLERYAAHFALPIVEGAEVQRARRDGCWQLQTTRGPVTAELLVVATGIWSTPFCPTFGGEERFRGRILHANDYKRPDPLVGERVLVVGVGNSGAEIAVELSEAGVETAISLRSGVNFVDYPTSPLAMRVAAWAARTLPRPLMAPALGAVRRDFSEIGLPPHPGSVLDAYPVVGYELPEAVAAGRVRVLPDLATLTERGGIFTDGTELPFDTIVLATGYRPTVDFVAPYVAMDARGRLQLDGWRSAIEPSLYLVGFRYPATEGWLQSIPRYARQAVADMVARRGKGERARREEQGVRAGEG